MPFRVVVCLLCFSSESTGVSALYSSYKRSKPVICSRGSTSWRRYLLTQPSRAVAQVNEWLCGTRGEGPCLERVETSLLCSANIQTFERLGGDLIRYSLLPHEEMLKSRKLCRRMWKIASSCCLFPPAPVTSEAWSRRVHKETHGWRETSFVPWISAFTSWYGFSDAEVKSPCLHPQTLPCDTSG